MKAIVYTTHKDTTWIEAQLPFIRQTYAAIGDALSVKVVSLPNPHLPKVTGNNVDWDWLNVTCPSDGFDCVVYDMSIDELHAVGITGAAAAYNRKPGITKHEFWMAHEPGKRIGMWSDLYRCSEFQYLFLHEVLHGLLFFNQLPDTVHDRAAKGTMFELFGEIGKIRKQRTSLLGALVAQLTLLTKQLFNMQRALPIPAANWAIVTQEYCVKDSVNYPRSGVHPGVDFRGAFGDPVFAPQDGEITRTGHDLELGFWVEYRMGTDYLVALHLKSQPVAGIFKKGDQIATLGTTGKIQGVHYHLEGWNAPMDRSLLISEASVRKYTFDIRTRIG